MTNERSKVFTLDTEEAHRRIKLTAGADWVVRFDPTTVTRTSLPVVTVEGKDFLDAVEVTAVNDFIQSLQSVVGLQTKRKVPVVITLGLTNEPATFQMDWKIEGALSDTEEDLIWEDLTTMYETLKTMKEIYFYS